MRFVLDYVFTITSILLACSIIARCQMKQNIPADRFLHTNSTVCPEYEIPMTSTSPDGSELHMCIPCAEPRMNNRTDVVKYISTYVTGKIQIHQINIIFIACGLRRRSVSHILFHITSLDLSNIGFTRIPVLKDFRKLEEFDLSDNRIEFMDYTMFENIINLRTLSLSNNLISNFDFSEHVVAFQMFPDLRLLDYSFNNISSLTISRHIFFKRTLLHFSCLDISYNNINEISPNLLEVIKHYKTLVININGNHVNCTNSTVKTDRKTGKNIIDLHDCPTEQQQPEPEHYTIILTFSSMVLITAMCMFMIVLGILLGHYWLNRKKSKCKTFCTQFFKSCHNERDEQERTGVYLVSSDHDSEILLTFASELERRNIATLFDTRDFAHQGGKCTLHLIHQGIEESKRTLLLVSIDFLRDKECVYILRAAKGQELTQNRPVLIIIKLKEPCETQNLHYIHEEFLHNICMDYPPDIGKTDEFWDTLVKCINNIDTHVHVEVV